MSVVFLEIFAAHGDGGEHGRGPVLAYCSTESQAKAVAKMQGWYGSDGFVGKAPAVDIDGKVYVLVSAYPVDLDGHEKARREDLRRQAIKKLTPEELAALGVKETP